jgi:hypothetical protein
LVVVVVHLVALVVVHLVVHLVVVAPLEPGLRRRPCVLVVVHLAVLVVVVVVHLVVLVVVRSSLTPCLWWGESIMQCAKQFNAGSLVGREYQRRVSGGERTSN